ncbi:MAG TPA: FKBP-type peptidyl-prolyl cis-trans isomerase [Caulobacterales bacterium]|nr:FKBP-type peptidyl-prolyl cis-trans isomerase [Caulobacterales bacterium]
MKKIILAAALLVALAACGDKSNSSNNDSSGVMREIERAEQKDAAAHQQAANEAQTFLAQARARPGAIVRPSGLVMEFTHKGANQSLPHPGPQSVVLVHYEGKLANGDTFDSSLQRGQPAQFPLDQVVPGFSEAIQQMRPGDEVIAYFPPELGYGAQGQPPVIPPNAPLQFRIQLLAFQGANGHIVQAPR